MPLPKFASCLVILSVACSSPAIPNDGGSDTSTGDADTNDAGHVAIIDRNAAAKTPPGLDLDGLNKHNRGRGCADDSVDKHVAKTLAAMTLEQKVAQMAGASLLKSGGLWSTVAQDDPPIAPFKMVDGPRGVSAGDATAFPVSIARAASWDVHLEHRVGEAIGRETRGKGGNVLLAPTINLLRHPSWGRAQESYGEDPLLLGRMGVGFISGAQKYVMASVKHLAVNSIEETRFDVDVTLSERTLRELYLPHFRMAVQQGHVASVMSAYNSVNGDFSSQNAHLLTEILREDWGFTGFVESDWVFAVKSTAPSALAGLDLEMPAPKYFGSMLQGAVEDGRVPEAVIDTAVGRMLRARYCFGFDDLPEVDEGEILSDAHRALAREAAAQGMVLLKNADKLLPLSDNKNRRYVLLGELAATANLGDRGSSTVASSDAVSIQQGLVARLGESLIVLAADEVSGSDEARVRAADALVVVVGLTHLDEGEDLSFIGQEGGGDRLDLRLSRSHRALIARAAELNDHVVVVMEGGSAITVQGWLDDIQGLLLAWYPGVEGGHALADVLLGDVNPSGKLPLSVPTDAKHLGEFDNVSTSVKYDYWHGYRKLDHEEHAPAFPFGFGLSYTEFGYERLRLSTASVKAGDSIGLEFDLTNRGDVAGAEVVQLYVRPPGEALERPVRFLADFAKVYLKPGETRRVALRVNADSLGYFDEKRGAFVLENGEHAFEVSASSRDPRLSAAFTVEP